MQFDIRRATYEPDRRDDLKPGTQSFVGQTCDWEHVGYRGVEESYPGQGMWTPLVDDSPGFAWAPECDLVFAL